MINNPYIEKVFDNDKIISNTEEIYFKKGKWKDFFQNKNEIYLEIGTGFGHFFSLESSSNLDKNFIGMEIKFKRLFKTREKSKNLGTTNFVLLKDFAQNIDKIFEKGEIKRTYIFFPDPWDKKDRQKKHKLLQKDFLNNLYDITSKGGELFFKTDHIGYFDEVLDIIKNETKWENTFASNDYEKDSITFSKQKITEFESMFRGEKLKINYAEFIKK